MGGAEYDPYESADENDEDAELEKVVSAHAVDLETLSFHAANPRCYLAWAIFYISLLLNPIMFRKIILREDVTFPITEPRIRPTADAMSPSLVKLKDWCVVRYAVGKEYALALASYFEVAKKNKKLRPIVDMRPFNAWLNTPPSVRLATIATFLRTVAVHGKNCWMSTGDMSGWFHQLSVPKGCHTLFGISSAGVLFFYTVLGMGMSWSPLISQACLVCIMLMRMAGDKNGDLGVDGSKYGKNLPPGLIEMDRKQGFLVGYYDNVFVFTKRRFLCSQWVARIKGNAKAVGAMWNPEEVLCNPTQSLVFLGMLLDTTMLPKWKHCLKKVEKWATWWKPFKIPAVFKAALTPRLVAKIVGMAVWDTTIRLNPLFVIAGVIEVLREIHTRYELSRKRDWYQHIELPDDMLKLLVEQMESLLLNEWHVPETPKAATREWIGASDACDYGIGFVILRGHDSGRFVNRTQLPDGSSVPGAGFPASLLNMHIYVKEIYAAL